MAITYGVYCSKVNSVFREKAERAANAVANKGYLGSYYVLHLREMIDTDEFRQVRARAVEAGDEGIIEEWMRHQPPVWYEMDYYSEDEDAPAGEGKNRAVSKCKKLHKTVVGAAMRRPPGTTMRFVPGRAPHRRPYNCIPCAGLYIMRQLP